MAMLSVIAWASPALAQLPCSYEVTVLPPFNSCFGGDPVPGTPTAINNLGHVLLFRSQCDDYNDTYLWTGGPSLTLIPRPPGMLGFTGWDLNDNGLVCGEAQYASPTGPRAVVYDTNTGQWTILPPLNPPQGWSNALALNNNNEVCGYRTIGTKNDPTTHQQAFHWTAVDGFTDYGIMNGPNSWATDIAEDGTIVGWTGGNPISAFTRAFVHAGGVTTILPAVPGGYNSAAFAVESAGRVAVSGLTLIDAIAYPRGFAYFDGNFIPLGVLPGFTRTFPVEVDAAGQVFGYCTVGTSGRQPFVWRDNSLVNLNSLITTVGMELRQVRSMSSGGSVVGDGRYQGDNRTLVLTPHFAKSGDSDCNGAVNVNDLLNVIGHWGTCHGCSSDLNGDENVDVSDLIEVLLNWG